MLASDTRTVLARKIAIHGGAGLQSEDLVPKLELGLGRAVRRAAAPLDGFPVSIDKTEITLRADLDAGIAALPEHGLLAATEDPTGHRGLLALEYTLVDALIEVQTTGRVEETQGPPRPVTRIDEALCRDFIDMVFSAFALETGEITGRDWPERISYGSQIKDRSQINLLLPARGYHLMQITVTAGGRKTGRIVVLLPADPALARQTALKAEKKKAPRPETWAEDVLSALGGAPLAMNAVLMRLQMPLSRVEALEDGDLIPFDHADLGSVTLEGDSGHVFARGKLGQLGGRRAVRLGGGAADSARAAAPSPGPAVAPGPGIATERGPITSMPGLSADSAGKRPEAEAMPPGGLPDLPIGGGLPDAPMAMEAPVAMDMPMAMDEPVAMEEGVEGLPPMPMAAFDPDAPIG